MAKHDDDWLGIRGTAGHQGQDCGRQHAARRTTPNLHGESPLDTPVGERSTTLWITRHVGGFDWG
ncbi:hypothetical protein GGTG_00673 [Gaeumannomyces tritici R3-111a-1]|uniref:Uncharacterized protein n=1 Tax=Gaeumannomyces tritici (strain R3-111a-1) TaxID=644352 RepID=J3NHD6_GAET3|nr:hypothetical protein GGTG_00673 [Gaeumannomyces tritici R3-111a-1]EJT80679.1 hypothetical protein GGTG_00673 [Gaeumannomyces tritici R3-111a-1]